MAMSMSTSILNQQTEILRFATNFIGPVVNGSGNSQQRRSNCAVTKLGIQLCVSSYGGRCWREYRLQSGKRRKRFVTAMNNVASVQELGGSVGIEEGVSFSGTSEHGRVEYPLETGVIVVGGGLAGLGAANQLAKHGIPFILLEGSDGVGGRVRTDNCQGFLLDRGFQVFISAYPEASQTLDYDSLDLREFYAGAAVWCEGRFHKVADPFRHVVDGLASLANPIGTVIDKILVGLLRFRAALRPVNDILSAQETTIAQRLEREGFSQQMVDRFFRPFFGGVFFDKELQTTSRLFDFVFKCLALGSNTLPAGGIGAIPEQIASNLPNGSVYLVSKVSELVEPSPGVFGVKLETGPEIVAKHGIIVAVEGPEAARLLKEKLPETLSVLSPPRSTVCLYFSSDKACIEEPILYLNGSGKGIVNNLCFPNAVAPSYAPAGKSLVSVSLVGTFLDKSDDELEQEVRHELLDWFGAAEIQAWQHLRTYRIPLAQPDQSPPTNLQKEPRIVEGVYVCGDHRDSSTFDGALVSGRRAVQCLLSDTKLIPV